MKYVSLKLQKKLSLHEGETLYARWNERISIFTCWNPMMVDQSRDKNFLEIPDVVNT